MKRRTFLQWAGYSALGALLVTLPSSGVLDELLRQPAMRGLRVFSEREVQALWAIAEAILAPLDARELRVVEKIDGLLAGADDVTQHDLKQLLRIFDLPTTAVFLNGRWSPFSQLPLDARQQALIGWRDSQLGFRRSGFQALQRLCEAVAYADPALYPAIGYPGPPTLVRRDGTTVGGSTIGGTP